MTTPSARGAHTEQVPALLLADVVAGYDHGIVLHGLSARLATGQVVALMGPNGSGKSTLLKVILGLMEPISGRVEVLGSAPSRLDRRRHQIGYMPQLRDVDRAFPATVFDLAMMGRVGRLGLFRRPGARDREIVAGALGQVGLSELANRPFGALSGGQQQRAFMARALAQQPDFLVLDEPAAGVDEEHRAQTGQLLADLSARGISMLIATHDIEELEPLAFDEHWHINRGKLEIDILDAAPNPDRHEMAEAAPAHRHGVGLQGLDRRSPSGT
jgi:ABC-type Mn2+/Zn2+ transport system ATPase subunit